MQPLTWLNRRWRACFHRYEIDDPRSTIEDAPYTFFVPSENELLALAAGDLVKLIFRAMPEAADWDAERMWVEVTGVAGDALEGVLRNEPRDMPQLKLGAKVAFRRSDVIDLIWSDDRAVAPPRAPDRREYWERCLVDACVAYERTPIHFLYREEPEPRDEDEKYVDSGWRIRGDYRDADDAALNAREVEYIALGAVLNLDDSWLHLIDAPVGSSFIRNWETGAFERDEGNFA